MCPAKQACRDTIRSDQLDISVPARASIFIQQVMRVKFCWSNLSQTNAELVDLSNISASFKCMQLNLYGKHPVASTTLADWISCIYFVVYNTSKSAVFDKLAHFALF